jgi:hypothetical protein
MSPHNTHNPQNLPTDQGSAGSAGSAGGKRVRVRRARHSGTCPVCRRLVLVGELIASVRGGPFMCISHVTRADTDGSHTDFPADQGGADRK